MTHIPGNLFPRNLSAPLPLIKEARGIYLTDDRGNTYMDASGGAIVVNAGHAREEIARAVYDQIMTHDYIHPTMFTSPPAEELASFLAEKAPGDINRFYFLSGGAEANEAAIKLARQIHLANGRPGKYRVIGRWKSYHGLTLGALSAMGRTAFKAPFTPMLKESLHIPAPYCYRCPFGLTHPDCRLRCAQMLEEVIISEGPDSISAFIAETVPGATIAACPPPGGYLEAVARICKRHDVLLILDEVMCGMGRTGKWFAYEHSGVVPDIVTLGKGLAGGVIALSAMGVKETHFRAVQENSGAFMHGGTFSHHPVAAAGGLALVRLLERENLVARAEAGGKMLGQLLKEHLLPLGPVGDVRGIGLLWGVELVADKKNKTPYRRSLNVVEGIWNLLFEKGFIVYKSTGLAGTDGDAFLVAPPYIITEDELETLVMAVKSAINTFFKMG